MNRRDKELRRAGAVTTGPVAASVVGSVSIAALAHARSTSTGTNSTSTSTSSTSSSSSGSTSSNWPGLTSGRGGSRASTGGP